MRRKQLEYMITSVINQNRLRFPDWEYIDLDWKSATWTECATLFAAIGGSIDGIKKPDLLKAKNCAAKICGFLMSWVYVVNDRDMKKTIDYFEGGLDRPAMSSKNRRHVVETFAGAILVQEIVSVPLFRSLMDAVDLSFDCLFLLFVGESVLARFRSENSFRDGGYVSTWDGQPDTEFLQSIVLGMQSVELDSFDGLESVVYRRLDNLYRSIVLNKAVCA